jgi:hypothetical protein
MQEKQDKNSILPDNDVECQDFAHNIQIAPEITFDLIREKFHHIFDTIEDVDAFVAEQRGR